MITHDNICVFWKVEVMTSFFFEEWSCESALWSFAPKKLTLPPSRPVWAGDWNGSTLQPRWGSVEVRERDELNESGFYKLLRAGREGEKERSGWRAFSDAAGV